MASEKKLIDRLITLLEDRQKQEREELLKGRKPTELMGTRLDLEWDDFYERLKSGYAAVSKKSKR